MSRGRQLPHLNHFLATDDHRHGPGLDFTVDVVGPGSHGNLYLYVDFFYGLTPLAPGHTAVHHPRPLIEVGHAGTARNRLAAPRPQH